MRFGKWDFQRAVICSVCIAFITSAHALAADSFYKSELTGGVDSTSGFVRVNLITDSSIQYAFTGSYSYSLDRHYQLGIQSAFANSGAQIDPFRYSIYIPVTLNWGGEDLRDDYFVRLAPGISYSNALNTALLVQFGKRFKLLENFTWRPTVGLSSQFGNGAARVAVDIIPLVFSVIF